MMNLKQSFGQLQKYFPLLHLNSISVLALCLLRIYCCRPMRSGMRFCQQVGGHTFTRITRQWSRLSGQERTQPWNIWTAHTACKCVLCTTSSTNLGAISNTSNLPLKGQTPSQSVLGMSPLGSMLVDLLVSSIHRRFSPRQRVKLRPTQSLLPRRVATPS